MKSQPKPVVIVTKERNAYPHILMLRVADLSLDAAKKEPEGSYYSLLHAILYSAIALEAMANGFGRVFIAQSIKNSPSRFGEKFLKQWEKDFDRLNTKDKFSLICEALNTRYDVNEYPWKEAEELRIFRNGLVHPKPQYIRSSQNYSENEYKELEEDKIGSAIPDSDLEKKITQEFAQKSVDCSKEIFSLFCSKIPDVSKEDYNWEIHFGLKSDCATSSTETIFLK